MMHTVSKSRSSRIRRYIPFYVMLALPTAYYIIFRFLPMYGIIIAFKDYDITKGIIGSSWSKPFLKNYLQFFNSPYAGRILRNTIYLSLYKLISGTLPPIILALLLNECRYTGIKKIVQTVTYMPHFLSWIIVYGVALALFSQTSGIINKLIVHLGGRSVPFLQSSSLIRTMLVGTSVWKETGWSAIIYLAAITAVDPSLFEAASIDGAGRLSCIWHVTLPSIRSTIIVMLLLRIGNIMDAGFEQVYAFDNTMVRECSDIIDTWVYRMGLQQLNFSVSAAVGLFKSAIGAVMIIGTNRIAKIWGESLW